MKISGAIAAPWFKLGETTTEHWQAMLRDNKAPWGELASPNLIITIPDSVMQQIKDPIAVMKLWETIIQGEMELAQLPQPFYRAQRLVLDEHMCAGAMHSGYPIMIHHSPSQRMISADVIADPRKLLTPSKGGANWGFFHELGHNMQNYDLVFDGTTEVSCNFFSLYMFDRLMGGRDGAHEGVSNEATMRLTKRYYDNGARYEDWVQEPFLGLIMFRQLQEAFGWETFKAFFRSYHEAALASPELRDMTQPEKRDMFVINFSKAAKRNLVPFFMKWGIPASGYAAGQVGDLKTWMPYNFPPAN
ncbi:M60 family metallopeptidase [Chitinophaga sedimenti]|uniref:M60 family metallopeptidase n=1 Tax=Chitinophaga sedimenti TaxID=2033606 RepID=UPI002003EFE7|nr:M60 family metallopeptidase [Chitinophaga sedimenti]MCK7556979.1 M60 family metallopeptidase [Chitinophaga sedimenti]